MKKYSLMALALVLSLALTIGGTLAYLADTDSDVNVMTLGEVSIEQMEYERAVDAKGDPVKGVAGTDFTAEYGITESYKLQPFTQAKPAYPAVYTNASGTVAWDEFQQLWNGIGAPGSNDLFDDSVKNVIDKFVFVKNTGISDAYYRTVIAFELPEKAQEDILHINLNTNPRFDYNVSKDGVQNSADASKVITEINGVRYVIYTATYTEVLKPNEISRPTLLQYYLDPKTTNEDCALFGDTMEVLVLSQAVQTAGFADPATALNAAFGPVDAANAQKWFGALEIPTPVATEAELAAAIAEGGSIVLANDIVLEKTVNVTEKTNLDLNGHTLTVSRLEAKADTTIENGSVVHGKSTYPALSVSAGTLTMNEVKVLCAEPCNIVTSGSAEAAEYAALEIWSGSCVLNDCDILAKSEELRYSNSVFAIGIHEGALTMNGGSITVTNKGSTKEKYNYEGAIFAGSAGNKEINLNDVEITLGEKGKGLFAWGGNTVINTTDAEGSWKVDARNGGTYQINYK